MQLHEIQNRHKHTLYPEEQKYKTILFICLLT